MRVGRAWRPFSALLSCVRSSGQRIATRMSSSQSGSKGKRIGTHSGTFHCDEATACFMLRMLPEYKGAEIIRSRDPDVLKTMDVLVDVGGEYDAARGRFDHHQRGFSETFGSQFSRTKLSSAGLIYKHFGRRIVQGIVERVSNGLGWSSDAIDALYIKVYQVFVEALDGIDNGVPASAGESNYRVSTDLSARVGYLNPAWNERGVDRDARFDKAMDLAGGEFVACVERLARSWLPARGIVQDAITARSNVDASGSIVLLETFCSWKSHLLELEVDMGLDKGSLLYVLYPDTRGAWRVQCVPEGEASFVSRRPLPEPWQGVRDKALSDLTGIPGCIFVHANGFIGGNATREGALRMAAASLAFVGANGQPAKKKARTAEEKKEGKA